MKTNGVSEMHAKHFLIEAPSPPLFGWKFPLSSKNFINGQNEIKYGANMKSTEREAQAKCLYLYKIFSIVMSPITSSNEIISNVPINSDYK